MLSLGMGLSILGGGADGSGGGIAMSVFGGICSWMGM
jgi:hypothetical protein